MCGKLAYRLAWQTSLNTENAAVWTQKTEETTCARRVWRVWVDGR